ncbi:MAG TPA: DsbA family protein [Candidatus Limnocylindrales bacterium]|nr:DsbA family protein [Candidatus Limnocylindrales bacterium]
MSRSPSKPTTRRERRAQARLDGPSPARKKIVRRAPSQRPAWQSPLALTSIGALVIGLVIIVVAGGSKLFGGSSALTLPETSYTGLTVNGASVGSPTAPVVMQVYSDFQCPACKTFVTTELPQLLRELVQPGLLRIETTDIDIIDPHKPGSTESLELAAGAYCAAQQNKYWDYHDLVFWNQGGENVGDHNAAYIDRVATAAGLDLTAFHACQARSDIRQPIKDATTAAQKAGISSTPTLVLGGQVIPGVPSYSQLKSVILQLAAQATPTVAPSGSPAASGSTAPSAEPTAPASAPPSVAPS